MVPMWIDASAERSKGSIPRSLISNSSPERGIGCPRSDSRFRHPPSFVGLGLEEESDL